MDIEMISKMIVTSGNKIVGKILLFIILLATSYSVSAQVNLNKKDSILTSEKFFFKTKDGIQLNGTITIPDKSYYCDKIAILVTPSQKNNQDYGGMFSSLAKSLGVKGIATLRFDNRSFSDTTIIDERYTMFDQSDDVDAAFEAIQSDKRFNKSKIGLIGHDEGGGASAIEAAQNERLSFLVTLSTCGIKGADFTIQQMIMPYYYLNNIPVGRRNNIVANTHKVIQYLENVKDTFSIEKNFREYLLTNIPNINAEELKMHVKLWLKPQLLAFLKYDPNLYFSHIKCPALIIHGMMDGLSNWEINLSSIERIFVKSGKLNYQIMALENIDHSYQYVNSLMPAFISVQHKPGWKPEYSENTWNRIAEWICHL